MPIELLRPATLKQPNMSLIVSQNSVYEYKDEDLGVVISKTLRAITIGEFGLPGKPTDLNLSQPSDKQLNLYSKMESLMKSCVTNAEDIKDRLLNILLLPRQKENDLKNDEITKYKFKKLKNLFMNHVLDTKIYKEFKTLNSTSKLSPFWKIFDAFIEDRNKYTHGHLCIIRPDFGYALEYIDGTINKSKYVNIDKDILVSYHNCYMEIRELITQYNVIHQERLFVAHQKKNNL